MTRLALAAVILSACSFSAMSADPGADGGPGTTGDGASFVAGCHIHDTSLRLCLDFEDPALAPVVHDGSSFQHDAATQNLAAMTRAGEQAAMFGSSSQATIPAAPDFAVSTLSLEAWVQTTSVWSSSWALLDSQHYGLGIAGGSVVCVIGDKATSSDATAYAGTWVHIACTNDGDHLTLYINGDAVDCSSKGDVKGTKDLGVGVGFTGGLDNVRLFAAAIPAAEICTHAGRTGCTATCTE